ncbi:MAG: hypothetical protein ACRD21_12215 [Vicinamibacteria bacterium]
MLVFHDLGGEDLGWLRPFGLRLVEVEPGEPIPGSYWGEPEAGLVGDVIHVRPDTPLHSVLHEASHCICMTEGRRADLYRDAGSDDVEEAAVCYFQILLADHLPGFGRERLVRDMDLWGYSFRRGSTRGWFEGDAEDARAWLERHGLVDERGEILWKLRFEE